MQKSVTRAVGKFNKAKALVRVVPLDDGPDRWTGRTLELWAARRRISEIAGWWLVVIIGEIAAATRTKISVSIAHVGFLRVAN
jgi:hypothetical protein